MLIDTHCHLNFEAFNKDFTDVFNRAKTAGIEKFIIPGAKIDSSKRAIEISLKYDSCYASVGIHPHHTDEFIRLGKSTFVGEFKKLITQKKVIAVGEIGLDYYEYKNYPPLTEETKKYQKELLLLQVEIATDNNLPVIFHCRDAQDDQLELIVDYIKSANKPPHGVFHCFDGEVKHLQKVIELGFYVGFDGNITYPGNDRFTTLIKYTPLDRLLLETDSPFLTPLPLRGQRNEPANLTYTAAFMAKILQVPHSELAEITTRNALKLFVL